MAHRDTSVPELCRELGIRPVMGLASSSPASMTSLVNAPSLVSLPTPARHGPSGGHALDTGSSARAGTTQSGGRRARRGPLGLERAGDAALHEPHVPRPPAGFVLPAAYGDQHPVAGRPALVLELAEVPRRPHRQLPGINRFEVRVSAASDTWLERPRW